MFQLKMGNFVNKELQKVYNADSKSVTFSVAKLLEYKDLTEDHSEDLEIIMLEFMEEHPEAKALKPAKSRK